MYSEKHFVYDMCMYKIYIYIYTHTHTYIWIIGYKVVKDKANFKLFTIVETLFSKTKI